MLKAEPLVWATSSASILATRGARARLRASLSEGDARAGACGRTRMPRSRAAAASRMSGRAVARAVVDRDDLVVVAASGARASAVRRRASDAASRTGQQDGDTAGAHAWRWTKATGRSPSAASGEAPSTT